MTKGRERTELEIAEAHEKFRPHDPTLRDIEWRAHTSERVYMKTGLGPLSSSVLVSVCCSCRVRFPCPTARLLTYVDDLEIGRRDDLDDLQEVLKKIKAGTYNGCA